MAREFTHYLLTPIGSKALLNVRVVQLHRRHVLGEQGLGCSPHVLLPGLLIGCSWDAGPVEDKKAAAAGRCSSISSSNLTMRVSRESTALLSS